MVPTVERGFFEVDFWSIETAGDRPSMKSTSGLSIWPRNWRAYAESDSTYRRWPSAKMVSKARLDLPEPDSPVKTISESRGRSSEMSLRLCSRAPRMMSWSATGFLGWSSWSPRSNTCSFTLAVSASVPRGTDSPILRGVPDRATGRSAHARPAGRGC